MSDAYFCVFWAEKNVERKSQGAEVLNFRETRREFGCHAPPPGAVTLSRAAKISVLSPAKRPKAGTGGTRSTGK
jgi:hypothetical protein